MAHSHFGTDGLAILVVVLALAGARVLAAAPAPAGAADLPAVDQLPAIQELPDPFVFRDGSRVKTTEDWARRREELKAAILYYEYGHMPPPAPVTAKELASAENDALGATEKEVLLSVGPAPDKKVSYHLNLTIPRGKGPFAAIVKGDLSWGRVAEDIRKDAAARGYIVAEFNRVEIAPDKNDRTTGVYPLYPDWDWGAESAWAWGFHRTVDYLLTLPAVDAKRIAVTGHSRGGKGALLAGAMDERIALVAPNGSGAGGSAAYRVVHPNGETMDRITKSFPFWFHPRFRSFVGKEDRLPFDQHSLKALVAPRPLLTTEASGDLWANPTGTQQAHLAAKVVFDFLGAGGKIGIHYRDGKHEHNAEDWAALLDFCDKQLFGKTVARKFDHLPDPGPKSFSWSAPAAK